MAIIQNTVKPENYHTDLLTLRQRIMLLFSIPKFKGICYITISLLCLIEPVLLVMLSPLILMMVFANIRYEFPSRLPYETNRIDTSDPKDSGKGFYKARGEVYLGWHRGTGKEAWCSWNDMLTHIYMLAATGGGKSEAIWAILSNFYLAGSGYSLGDGKGTLEMIQNGRVLARIFGVEDDYFVINYISPNPNNKHKLMSNTLNTWSQGTAAQLKEQMASLALSGDAGQNQFFEDNAEVIIETVFPALVELRDKGVITLDIQTIGSNLTLANMYELSRHTEVSAQSRRFITDYLKKMSFNFDTPHKQSDEVNKQYGQFVTHFSKVISSLSIQYRDIYVVDQGDINQKDITSNRRTLIFALPSLEKSGSELKNLGNIILTGQKNAVSTDLGNDLEGSREKTTARLSKNYKVPYALAFDEWAFYAIKDMALLPAQIRGLKYCGLYAAQDYKGTERAGEMDAEQVFANTRVKFFGALEEAGASWTRIRDLIGEYLVAINSNYKYLPSLFGGRQIIDHEKTEISKRAPIEISDLQKQVSGEFFLFQRSKLSPIRFFHTDLGGLDSKAVAGNDFKINRLCRLYPPNKEQLDAIDQAELIMSVMFSSGRIYSDIDSIKSIKRNLDRSAAISNDQSAMYIDSLTRFLTENALKFNLVLNTPKLTSKKLSTSQVGTDVQKVIDAPEQLSAVPATNGIKPGQVNIEGEAEALTFDDIGLDTFMMDEIDADTNMESYSSSVGINDSDDNISEHQLSVDHYLQEHSHKLAEETTLAKMDIITGNSPANGAHLLSENESKRIIDELRIINNLIGFDEKQSQEIAKSAVLNLHKHCYYLAPPKPQAFNSALVSELNDRVDQLLN